MRSQLRQWQSNNHFPWRELVGNHSCFYRQYHWLTIEIGITTMVITAIFIFQGRVNRRWDTSSAVIIASFVAAHSFTAQGQFFAIVSHTSLIFGAKACIETKIFYLTQSIHAKRTLQISNFANGSPKHVKQLEIFLVGSSAQQLQTKLSSQNSWLRSGQRSCSSYWEKEQLLFVPKFHAMGGADRNVVILGNCGS